MQPVLPPTVDPALLPAESPQELVAAVVERRAPLYKRHLRRPGCGPGAARYEHWAALAADGDTGVAVATKKDGGVRRLGCV